jgi:hypothetical protein
MTGRKRFLIPFVSLVAILSPTFPVFPAGNTAHAEEGIGDNAAAVGEEFKQMGKATGKAAKEGGKATGKAFKEGGKTVGKAFKEAGQETGKAFKELGKEFRDPFPDSPSLWPPQVRVEPSSVDPLLCRCGERMGVVGFITQAPVIRKIQRPHRMALRPPETSRPVAAVVG